MTIILSNLNEFTNFFALEDSLVNFQLNGYLKIPPHLAYVATLPCETLMSANKPLTTNYKVVWLHIEGMVGLLITKLRKVYC